MVATDCLLRAPPCVCTAFCVYRLACGRLNNKTPAVATARLLCAPPCVCTAFCVHRLARGPLNNKTPAVATIRLLCAMPCVWTTLSVHRLVGEPPKPPVPPGPVHPPVHPPVRPPPPSSLPHVPRPTVGPSSGMPTPLRMRPPQPDLRDAHAPGTPTDPTVCGTQGHHRPPAGPPAPPRDRHGPRTRMAPPPPRPPAATHAPGPGLDVRGLPHAGHRDRHQGTTAGPNTTRHQPYIRDSALVLPPLCPPSPLTDARARPHHRGRDGRAPAPPGTRRPHHNTCKGD